jgi:streptomycin 6-kinase
MRIPEAFARTVGEVWGDLGREWLRELPALQAGVLRDWELTPGELYRLSFNWVVPVRRADGSPAVLKLGVPQSGHLTSEAAALTCFAGQGAVEVLAHDSTRGALLIERAEPGTMVRELVEEHDEQATAVLIDTMRRLHRPPPPGLALEELSGRTESFAAHLRRFPGDDPIPRHLVERAGRLFGELCASATERVVLHGDLHHDNVLAADREPWLAIDPHGVIGDPGYELGALLYNPMTSDAPVVKLLPSRIEQLADGLAMPVERVVAWGFAQAVLSLVWTAEGDGKIGGRDLEVALSLWSRLP